MELEDGVRDLPGGDMDLRDGDMKLQDGGMDLRDGGMERHDGVMDLRDGALERCVESDVPDHGSLRSLAPLADARGRSG